MRKIFTWISGLAALGIVLFPALATAESLSINFESYSAGNINGQDGWTALGSAGSGCAVYDEGVSSSLGTAGFGSQSFRISNAATSGCFGDQAFSKPLSDSVGEAASTAGSFPVGTKQSHFETQFDIASTVPGAQQTGLAISVSPDRGDGSRMSYLRFEDGASGINVFFDDVTSTGTPGSDVFNESQVGTNLNRAVPHTIKLTFDAVDGPSNDVVKVYIDGSLVKTGTSWEDYYRYDAEASAEQSPRIVRTVLFRAGGTAVPANDTKGFLFDNLSLKSGPAAAILPTSKQDCKNGGWQNFSNPSFQNQGQCIKWVQAKAHGDLRMSGPRQRIEFNVANVQKNHDNSHWWSHWWNKNSVEYWNFDYPGVLHYKADVACANVNPKTDEARFMFQIPPGHPGLSGLYVVAYVKENHGHHNPDLYGHAATADLNTATQWCQTGAGFAPTMYTVTGGDVDIE